LVPQVVPPERISALEKVLTWDSWDPNRDGYEYSWEDALK